MSIDYSKLTLADLEHMSDEDFAKVDISQIPVDETTSTEQEPVTQEPSAETETEQQQTTVEEETPTEVEQEPGVTANETTSAAEESQDADDAGDEAQQTTEQTQEQTTEEATTEQTQTAEQVSPEKAFYDKVTAEFNANGKQFKIDNPDDVVSLMQKGLNYNQKMAAIKPSLKIVRALQDAGINTLEDLGPLLDLKAKKPEAIAKLVQDAGIDTYELNEEKAKAYVPSVPQVSDELMNFQLAAQALEDNPHFATVVQQLGTYDANSQEKIVKNPHLLNLLTEHVQHGFYDKIVAKLEQEKAVGRIAASVPFLDAYSAIGDAMFAQQQAQTAQQPQQAPVQQVVTQPAPKPVPVATKPKAVNNTARQAAASTTSTATQVQKTTMTPEELWNLSDEEFAKIDPKFLA